MRVGAIFGLRLGAVAGLVSVVFGAPHGVQNEPPTEAKMGSQMGPQIGSKMDPQMRPNMDFWRNVLGACLVRQALKMGPNNFAKKMPKCETFINNQ